MKSALFAAAMLLPLSALAQNEVIQDSTEFARVLNYAALPGPQIARQVCAPVAVTHTSTNANANNAGGAIAGGLIGALIGSRFGGGHGREAATVAGAIGGAMIGGNAEGDYATASQQQCSTVYEAGPPSGYQVTYDYKGKLLSTTTRSAPGEYLRVRNRITVE